MSNDGKNSLGVKILLSQIKRKISDTVWQLFDVYLGVE